MGTCFSSEPVPVLTDVCQDTELEVGRLREVKFGDKGGSCVVVKDEKGKIHALSGRCTHYGANLSKGSYSNGKVRCPWHGACFNVETGDIEDFPGLDSLHKYEVDVAEDGMVRINTVVNGKMVCGRRKKSLVRRDYANDAVVVIVGGGAAAQEAAETLRQNENFDGRVILISKEVNLPYDRPKLSKSMACTADEIALRPPGFYDDADIEVLLGTAVTSVDTIEKQVQIDYGDNIKYDKLILATGSTPRTLDVPGSDLGNIFTLRTSEDANDIARESRERNVVVIGTSFIGMEVAAYLADKAESVTLVGNRSVPFQKSLGTDIGQYLMSLYIKKGVNFIMSDSVTEFVGNGYGNVGIVEFEDHDPMEADVVVLGIGVTPNTAFLEGSGIDLTSHGFVRTDDRLETNVQDIFAAGDIASFPLSIANDEEVTIGHWQLALYHGKVAGLNAAGVKDIRVDTVPFFWTYQFGKSIRYAGYNNGFDSIVYNGQVEEGEFEAYYCKDGQVVAVATLMRDPVAADFAHYLSSGKILKKDDIQSGGWRKSL